MLLGLNNSFFAMPSYLGFPGMPQVAQFQRPPRSHFPLGIPSQKLVNQSSMVFGWANIQRLHFRRFYTVKMHTPNIDAESPFRNFSVYIL